MIPFIIFFHLLLAKFQQIIRYYTIIYREGSGNQDEKYFKNFFFYNLRENGTYKLKNGRMMLRRILIALTLTILLSNAGKAQDAEFSQFFANPLYLNPALTAAGVCHRAVSNYRNQWPGMAGNYVTYNVSYDQYIGRLHGGLGVLVNVDNAGRGILRTTQASLIYAYQLRVSNAMFFNFALQGTFYQKTLNWDLLRFGDQIDPLQGSLLPTSDTPPDYNSIIFPDFDAGFVFGWKGVLHGGVAVHHMAEPNMSYYMNNENKLPMKFTAHFGANINPYGEGMDFDPILWISPNVLYQQQGNFHQINMGVYIVHLPLVIGTWYRLNFENADAVIALIGINYKKLKIGYSYDITMSPIKSDTGGAHEISLTWQYTAPGKLREIFRLNAPGF